MENPSVIAIVVTHDRLELLKKCLDALAAQTQACDVLVVDNASSDGTEAWLKACRNSSKRVHCIRTDSNLGGAGGFNLGIRWGVEQGYGRIWLMDDDTLPRPDALEKLLEADEALSGSYGWLSSVALWTDGSECKMNRQKLKKSFYEYSPLLKYGLVQAEQATFVSLFLRSEVICRFGLPIKEYYIWGDDIEYTRRIAMRGGFPCFIAGQSQVIHAMKENRGSSIANDGPERLERYRYAFRNEAHLYRKEGVKGILYYLAKCGVNALRILRSPAGQKLRRLGILLSGFCEGILFCPSIEMIDYKENQ